MAAPLQVLKHDGPVQPNSYIIKLKEDVSTSDHLDLLNSSQARITSCIEHEYHEEVYKGYAATLNDDDLAFLLSCDHVESVAEDGICSALFVPNDSYEVTEQEFPEGGEEASTQAAQDIDVYGLDTGIYIEHSCFGGRARWGANFTQDGNNDKHGHGTHTAATAVGNVFGQATSAKVIAVKVLGDNGNGSYSGIIAGINWAFQQGRASQRPSVVNMSLGGSPYAPLDDAVRNATRGGMAFSIAAGNENQDSNNKSPARTVEANTVGAVDSSNKKASFSNFGPVVDVWAPGVGILSAWIGSPNAARRLDGTSMAAPRVAGYMAVALGNGRLTPADLANNLKKHAKPVVIGAPAGTTNLLAQRW